MKKAIIIVVVIAVVILGGLVLLSKSQPKIDQTIVDLKTKQADVLMKATTAQIMVMVGQYYLNDKNTVVFEKNPASTSRVQNLLTQLKTNRGIDAAYSVKSTSNEFVVKTMSTGSDVFYCGDTSRATPDVIVVPISSDNFTSATDCAGQPLR